MEPLNLTEIDGAVGDAFGNNPKSTPKPSSPNTIPAPIRYNNPGSLMRGGKMVQYPTMEEGLKALDQNLASYGKKGINTLSDVIATWAPPSENNTNAYIDHVSRVTGLKPNQKIDLSNPLVRHQISAGITQMESSRNAIYNQPAAASTAAVPSFEEIGTNDINSAVQNAFTQQAVQEQKPRGVVGKVGEFLRGQGRAAASLVDTGLNAVTGALDVAAYPFARAYYGTQMSPEAAAAKAKEETTSPKDILGHSLGIQQTPEYKGEASRRAMDYIGANLGKGVDAIQQGLQSQGINIPKSDVENMMNSAMMVVPGGVKAVSKTKPVQAVTGTVGREAGYVGQAVKAVTPEPIQRTVGNVVEAVAPGTTSIKPKAAPSAAPQAAPYAQSGRSSVGAAATTDPTMIKQALQSATPEFQQLYGNMPLDKVNTPVVMRHLEGDSLPIPVRLTEGQATGDLVKISHEQNIRGKPEGQQLAYRFNEQNKALVDNVPAIKEQAAPDVYAPRTIESSEAIIKAYKDLDNARNNEISTAYKALEDANGGQFPVDGQTIAKNAEAMLAKKLKSEFLPSSIKSQLDRFKAGEQMTFEQFEAMRTNLAAEIRKAERSGDGNASQAASIVRQALEDLPMAGKAAGLKPLADKARTLAKARFDALKKDPAYRAAIDDKVPADKFMDTFVIKGHNKNVQTMVDTFGRDSEAHQHMMAGVINHLGDRAGVIEGKGNFSQNNYNTALNNLDKNRNLGVIFNPETQLQLKTLGNVANYTQFQPRGSFVNNSNTLVGYLAEKGANAAENVGNMAGLKFMGGYPIGSEARRIIRSRKEKTQVEKSLQPGAGSTLDEISKTGRK